ncbi:MAG: hypothetical protein H0U39_12905, partial [Segetibacter sp.]|nr:hypothetical protein [Segetibacter sp.]
YIKGADSRREKTYQRLLLRHVNEFLILARETATSEFVPIEEGVNYTGFQGGRMKTTVKINGSHV